jgi:hypothetical protein
VNLRGATPENTKEHREQQNGEKEEGEQERQPHRWLARYAQNVYVKVVGNGWRPDTECSKKLVLIFNEISVGEGTHAVSCISSRMILSGSGKTRRDRALKTGAAALKMLCDHPPIAS